MDTGTFTDEMVHQWLQVIRSGAWISLHYESPALNLLSRGEISGGGYRRQKVEFTAPSSRTMWNTTNAKFDGIPANRLTHFGIWDTSSRGILRAYGPLPEKAIVLQGASYNIPDTKIALSIA